MNQNPPATGLSRALQCSGVLLGVVGATTMLAPIAIGDDTDLGRLQDTSSPFDGGQLGDNMGACCFDDGSCDMVTAIDCALSDGFYRGTTVLCTPDALGGQGMYLLQNHPDGNAAPPLFGLRLDELFDLNPDADDIFTFDFEAEGAAMYLTFLGDEIVIQGTAFGGRVVDGAYDPNFSSMVEIYFSYNLVQSVPGDDDLMVPPPQAQNSGWIKWLETGETIGLWDTAGEHPYSFRLGDMDDELGHRGYDGVSGFGWLNHGDPDVHYYSSDWLFAAVDVCDNQKIYGACCVGGTCVDTTYAACIALNGVYQGDFTDCDGGVTCTIFADEQCFEDFDGDREVGVQDLLLLLADWGACDPNRCPCDLNRDDVVGVDDMLRVLSAWGSCD